MDNADALADTHFHWQFMAYDQDRDDGGTMVYLMGYLSEADARMAVENIVKRKQYILQKVWQCCTRCTRQDQETP